MRAFGVICDKNAIRYTVVDDDGGQPEESALSVPASRNDRGDRLSWLLEEMEDLLRRSGANVVFVKKAGSGQFASSSERHEVEAVVQIAAHRCHVRCELKTTDQLRAAAQVPKKKGAFEELLARPDVATRSSKDKRERYLYAVTALDSSGGRQPVRLRRRARQRLLRCRAPCPPGSPRPGLRTEAHPGSDRPLRTCWRRRGGSQRCPITRTS